MSDTSDPRVEAVARWLSQNVVSGTLNRDPDSKMRGELGHTPWPRHREALKAAAEKRA